MIIAWLLFDYCLLQKESSVCIPRSARESLSLFMLTSLITIPASLSSSVPTTGYSTATSHIHSLLAQPELNPFVSSEGSWLLIGRPADMFPRSATGSTLFSVSLPWNSSVLLLTRKWEQRGLFGHFGALFWYPSPPEWVLPECLLATAGSLPFFCP